MPLCEAPSIGSALPPWPSLNGIRYRSNLNGSLSLTNSGTSFSLSRTLVAFAIAVLRGTPSSGRRRWTCRRGSRSGCSGRTRGRRRPATAGRSGLGVVDDEDALDREEELREPDVGRRHEHRAVLDRADHVAAVGRDLGEQAEGGLAVLPLVVAPGDDLLVVQHHLLGHGQDRVGALVVAVVDIHAQHAAVGRERVAIAADRQVLQHDGRPVAESIDPKRQRMREGSFTAVMNGQRNLAIEDRVPHRVLWRSGCGRSRKRRLRVRADADDRHLCVSLHAALLDLGPIGFRGAPAGFRRREPQHLVRVVESQQDHPLLNAHRSCRSRRRSGQRSRAGRASRRGDT